MRTRRSALVVVVALACSRGRQRSGPADLALLAPEGSGALAAVASRDGAAPDVVAEPAFPPSASPCEADASPRCHTFESAESAFAWVLAHRPAILAIGEAHAQKGTELVPSATARFTRSLLPLLRGRATDLVVELWAPDARCAREVESVRSAQAEVRVAQAAASPNEYLALGTRAKDLGTTPWLLRPTCDDFAALVDAGEGSVDAMLRLVRRLAEAKVLALHDRAREAGAAAQDGAMIVAYGGALHNDVAPRPELAAYTFGPSLVAASSGRYVELDLIVPEYIKDTESWRKLVWYAAFRGDAAPDRATLFVTGPRSFVLIFPKASAAPPGP